MHSDVNLISAMGLNSNECEDIIEGVFGWIFTEIPIIVYKENRIYQDFYNSLKYVQICSYSLQNI